MVLPLLKFGCKGINNLLFTALFEVFFVFYDFFFLNRYPILFLKRLRLCKAVKIGLLFMYNINQKSNVWRSF